MFTPRLNSSRSGYSPFTTPGRTPSSTTKAKSRRSGMFTPQRRSQRRTSTLQTSFIGEDVTHRLDNFGLPPPIQVTEALALSDKGRDSSFTVDASGWSWLTCDRRLFLWKININSFHCKELTLPPTKGSHKASLVCVIPATDGSTVACVVASPEGTLRCWSNINNEGAFTECSVDPKDEECSRLIALTNGLCVLGTDKSSMYMVTPGGRQGPVNARPLKLPQGMFSGISRRMSSFIFGAGPVQTTGMPLIQLMVGEPLEEGEDTFYVLSGRNLQKWQVHNGCEKMLYQCDIDRFLRECAAESVWRQEPGQLPNLKSWILDMQPAKDGLLILGACVNMDVSPTVYYILGNLHTEGCDAPQSFLSFTIPDSKHTTTYQEDDVSAPKFRLLLPDVTAQHAYLVDSTTVLCVSVNSSHLPVDKVEFHASGDKLLGAGVCESTALFFSLTHGIVVIKSSQPDTSYQASILEEPSRLVGEMSSVMETSRIQEMSVSEDDGARLKAAFLHTCQGNASAAQSIIDELYPSQVACGAMDAHVVRLSEELIDDFPASDPRWAESVPKDAGTSSTALIIQHQLDDKMKAHCYLLDFLKNVTIWDRLSTVTVQNSPVQTRLALCEHAEKLAAALALRKLHSEYPRTIDSAIDRVLVDLRGEGVPDALTPQDVFYRQVSRVEQIVVCLVEQQNDILASNATPDEIVSSISQVNAVLQGMLGAASQYRQREVVLYSTSGPSTGPEYIPWTVSGGPDGFKDILRKQHEKTLAHAIPQAQDASTRGTLYQQLVELTDLILDGCNVRLDSLRRMPGDTDHFNQVLHEFEQERQQLIMPFVEQRQYERAASLAEKYCEFVVLIRLCEATSNQERLQRYINQFQSKGFADQVFKYYAEGGKRGQLLAPSLAKNPRLGNFLQSGENRFMSWLHDINSKDFYNAHKTLHELAEEETKFVAKKKTLLSLSKLAALASETSPEDLNENIEEINTAQDLILHQELLPKDVIEALALDQDNMRVLTSEDLIELYLSDYNLHANEFDFKKALDLTQFVNNPETNMEDLKLHIWCRAILRDSWDTMDTTDPLLSARDTVFFKTVELACAEGINLREFLPDVNKLLETEELGDMRYDRTFQFIVKAGYEHLDRILP